MIGKRSFGYALAALLLGLACASIIVAQWLMQPPRLVVGHLEGASPETAILKAFARRAGLDRRPAFRLGLRGFADAQALRAAFRRGEVDLAPFATWESVPDMAETVAVLQRTRVLLVALERDGARRAGAVSVGLVAGDDHEAMLGRLVVAAAFEAGDVETLSPVEAARALQNGRMELVAVVAGGPGRLRELITALPAAQQARLNVRPPPNADQLSRRNPAVEPVELKIGSASSDPLLPDNDIEALSVTTRLMARRSLDEAVVGDVTRSLLSMQRRLAQETPAATQLEPPATDRGAAFPAHAGAVAYVEGAQQTFFDRYGDWIYLGLFGGSALGSIWAGLASWREAARRRADCRRLAALQSLLGEIARARTIAEIDEVTAGYRAVMEEVLGASARLQMAQTDLVAFLMASSLFQEARRERLSAVRDAGRS